METIIIVTLKVTKQKTLHLHILIIVYAPSTTVIKLYAHYSAQQL